MTCIWKINWPPNLSTGKLTKSHTIDNFSTVAELAYNLPAVQQDDCHWRRAQMPKFKAHIA